MAAKNAGRSGSRWRKLSANQRAKRQACWICQQPIDYTTKPPDPNSFSVDHIKPRSTHPHLAEEPSNLASCHLGCNKSRGARAVSLGLGSTAEQW